MKYWLMKSEPSVYSIEDLKRDKKTLWEGVRNYQARNFMMKEMKVGDQVIFYHSNAEPAGAAGIAEISGPAVPDPTALNKKSEYYDPDSTKEKPSWYCVEVGFKKTFSHFVPLEELRSEKGLKDMMILRKGNRLSITPLTQKEFETISRLGGV